MSESVQKKERERERENESGAKRICINNGMVFKFRLVTFVEICMLVDKTKRKAQI